MLHVRIPEDMMRMCFVFGCGADQNPEKIDRVDRTSTKQTLLLGATWVQNRYRKYTFDTRESTHVYFVQTHLIAK